MKNRWIVTFLNCTNRYVLRCLLAASSTEKLLLSKTMDSTLTHCSYAFIQPHRASSFYRDKFQRQSYFSICFAWETAILGASHFKGGAASWSRCFPWCLHPSI